MHDVIVIGGGIAGVSAAYFLAQDGVDVLLLERGDLNSQASGANSGSLHAQIPFEPFVKKGEQWAREFAPVVRLLVESIDLWRKLPDVLKLPPGRELEVTAKGGLIVAATSDDMRLVERKAEIERMHGLDVRLLTRNELQSEAPYLSEAMIGGALCQCEGSANPSRATPALAAHAGANGATIRTHTQVTGLERNGSTYRVRTDKGDFEAPRILNAAGARCGEIAAMLGVNLTVEGYPIQASVTERVEPLMSHLLYFTGEKLTLKQTAAGTIIIGGGWPARLDAFGRPTVDGDSLAYNLGLAVRVVPQLSRLHLARAWAATVNGTDDWKPIFGELPGVPNFHIVFFPWLGFTGGPLSGRIAASLIQGKRPPVSSDLRPFMR